MSEQLYEDVKKWWDIWHRSFHGGTTGEDAHFRQAIMYSFLYIVEKLKKIGEK